MKDMNELCKCMAKNALMISVYTDEIRNDHVLHIGNAEDDEMQMNKNLTMFVSWLEFWND